MRYHISHVQRGEDEFPQAMDVVPLDAYVPIMPALYISPGPKDFQANDEEAWMNPISIVNISS
jgi:hypothetical protein